MKFHESNYFIDWIALHIPFKPYSEIDRKYEWTKFQHKVFDETTQNQIHKHFWDSNNGHYKELLNCKKEPWNIFKGQNAFKLEFRGSFFLGNSIKHDLIHFLEHYEMIIDILRYNGQISLGKPSVYRLDVSANIKAKLRFTKKDKTIDSFTFQSNRKVFKNPFCRNLKNPDEITGYQWGNSGRQSIALKLYDKKHDTNKAHDLIRFGDDDFLRIEYSIGSDKLKHLNLKSIKSFFNLITTTPGHKSYTNLPLKSEDKIKELLTYLHWSKSVTFSKDAFTKWQPKKITHLKKPYNAKSTIQSLIFNHTTPEDRIDILENLLNYDNTLSEILEFKKYDGSIKLTDKQIQKRFKHLRKSKRHILPQLD
jgi:hypothetical protein